jgi:hypothetical protein
VPLVSQTLAKWRKRVLIGDSVLMGATLLALLIYSINANYWQGFSFQPPWLGPEANMLIPWVVLAAIILLLTAIHFTVRGVAARTLVNGLRKKAKAMGLKSNPVGSFIRSTKPWRSIFSKNPAGWGRRARKKLTDVVQSTDTYIQTLNDQFTNPSGSEKLLAAESTAPATPATTETPEAAPTVSS